MAGRIRKIGMGSERPCLNTFKTTLYLLITISTGSKITL